MNWNQAEAQLSVYFIYILLCSCIVRTVYSPLKYIPPHIHYWYLATDAHYSSVIFFDKIIGIWRESLGSQNKIELLLMIYYYSLSNGTQKSHTMMQWQGQPDKTEIVDWGNGSERSLLSLTGQRERIIIMSDRGNGCVRTIFHCAKHILWSATGINLTKSRGQLQTPQTQ